MNIKKLASKSILIVALLITYTVKGQKIVFMPQWTAQAQFTGYYVALEKGFYKDEGIEVEIKHIGQTSTGTSMEMMLNNEVDITCDHLTSAIKYAAQGHKIVNILQTSQNNALMCVGNKPMKDLTSLNGKDISVWVSGYGDICTMVEKKKNLQINWIKAFSTTNLLLYKAVDATLCYSYNEFLQLQLSMDEIPIENTLYFSDYGYNYPEDGVYVTEKYYNSHKNEIEKFARASKRGWDYAREHPEEALDIVMRITKANNITTNKIHQKLMLQEILRLQINKKTNKADFAPISKEMYQMITTDMQNANLITNIPPYNLIFRANNE